LHPQETQHAIIVRAFREHSSPNRVHLLHLYSNTPGLLSDLEAVLWTVGRTDLEDEHELPSTKRPWRLRDRLSESDLDAIVLRFKHGETMAHLAREYGITDWSVRNLIKKRGQRLGLDVPPPGEGEPDDPTDGH